MLIRKLLLILFLIVPSYCYAELPTVVFGSTTYRFNPFMNPAKRQQWDDVSAENLGGYTSGQFLLLGGSQTVSGQPVFNNIILGTATYVLDSALLNGYTSSEIVAISTNLVPSPDLSAYAIKLDVSNSTDAITTQLYQVAIDTTATINELRDNYARLDSSPTWTGSITTPSVYVSSFVTTQDLNVLGKTRIRMDHATFYSTTTQSIAVVNATQTITLDGTIDSHGGITFDGATGCVTVLDGGSYLIGFSAIPQGTNGNRLFIFPRINNIDVPYSNTIWQFTGGSAPKVETVFYNLDMNAGDEICLIMYSNNASTELLAIPATTVPIAPAMPSIIITVNKTGEQQ